MEISAEDKWQACLADLRKTIADDKMFDTWIEPLKLVSLKDERLTVSVPNKFVRDYIEAHYLNQLRQVLVAHFGENIRLLYAVQPSEQQFGQEVQTTVRQPQRQQLPHIDPQLNHRYTFDNYVEGKSNKLALTVALAIANNPSQSTFNPLFLYGSSGVGKTHLVNAIGLRIREKFPERRVLFVPVHIFKTQYTESVRQGTTNDFIAFYQTIDVLIIDDIQELTTPKTQQAFFHVFNHLHLNNRQIIITCDRAPAQLDGMEERMLTRFKWGMTAEIERPDIQLRIDILKAKIYRDGLTMSDRVVKFVAQGVTGSVRELEGVVNSMMAYSISYDCEIDEKLAASVIARTIPVEQSTITLDDIVQTVGKHYGIKQKDILSKSRKQAVVTARQVSMYLSKKYLDISYSQIGQRIGKRDHSTVLHSCNLTAERLAADKSFRNEVEEIEQTLKK